jgi:hypothetical protein
MIDINLILRSNRYDLMQEKKRTAYAEYNYAGAKLELSTIRERNAELGSQAFEYIAKGELQKRLGELTTREREIGLAFARYATYGRTDEA